MEILIQKQSYGKTYYQKNKKHILEKRRKQYLEKTKNEIGKQIIIKNNVLITFNDRPFRCHCGANVFSVTTNGNYICNGCHTLYYRPIKLTTSQYIKILNNTSKNKSSK